jgi:hypothetical protein
MHVAINAYLAICGFLSILLWLKPWNLGAISTLLNSITTSLSPILNIDSIKTSSQS